MPKADLCYFPRLCAKHSDASLLSPRFVGVFEVCFSWLPCIGINHPQCIRRSPGTGGTGGSGAAPQLYDVNSMADFWSWLRLGFVPLVARASWAFSEELGQAQLRPFRGLLVGVGSCGAEATRAQRRGI